MLLDGIEPAGWRAALGDLAAGPTVTEEAGIGKAVVVPVTYDGADLAVVAAAWACDEAEVVQRHLDTAFTVAFCGFAPGFAYATSHGELPEVPRRESPRTRVPAGSVALAGEFCGIYPRDMPGGWQLIGRTDLALFDPDRDEPALLRPGDRVRFEARRRSAAPDIAGGRPHQLVNPAPASRDSRRKGESQRLAPRCSGRRGRAGVARPGSG